MKPENGRSTHSAPLQGPKRRERGVSGTLCLDKNPRPFVLVNRSRTIRKTHPGEELVLGLRHDAGTATVNNLCAGLTTEPKTENEKRKNRRARPVQTGQGTSAGG